MARNRESYDTEASPIERFFASYSDFPYNPSQPSAEQFQSMRRSYGWRRGDAEGESAWEGFRLALVKEFNWLFGTDEDDLLAWQNLCAFVGVPGRFETSNECVRVRSICVKHPRVAFQLIPNAEFGEPTLQSSRPDRYPSAWKRSRSSISHQGSIAGIPQDGQPVTFPTTTPRRATSCGDSSEGNLARPSLVTRRRLRSSHHSFPTRDGRAKAKERKDDMLPVSRKSKGHHRMIAESIEAAGALREEIWCKMKSATILISDIGTFTM